MHPDRHLVERGKKKNVVAIIAIAWLSAAIDVSTTIQCQRCQL